MGVEIRRVAVQAFRLRSVFSTLYAGLLLTGSRFFECETPLALCTVGIPGTYRCSTES